jgi:hypothetical protein
VNKRRKHMKVPTQSQHWQPCPPGELTRLAIRLRVRRRWRFVGTTVLVLLVGAALTVAGVQAGTAVSKYLFPARSGQHSGPGCGSDAGNQDCPPPCPP